jgi:hypothetical protein
MDHDHDAVPGEVDVELDRVDAERRRLPERLQRVLRCVGRVPAMADHGVEGSVEQWVGHSSRRMLSAKCCNKSAEC